MSLGKAVWVVAALASEGVHLISTFVHLANCRLTSDCPVPLLGLLETLNAVSLMAVGLSVVHAPLGDLVKSFRSKLKFHYSGTWRGLVVFLVKCFSLYVIVAVELVRKGSTESGVASMVSIALDLYTKSVIYTADNLLLSLLFLLELHFVELNRNLKWATQMDDKPQIGQLLSAHWTATAVVRQTSTCLGVVLALTLLFKQLHIVGMIYFNFLSDIPDAGSDFFQSLDIFLPAITLSLICLQTTKTISECLKFGVLIQDYVTTHDRHSTTTVDTMISVYPQLVKEINIEITSCDFLVVRTGLLLKISSVASTFIVAMVQISPFPDNVTIAD